jgi:hypothetical protein
MTLAALFSNRLEAFAGKGDVESKRYWRMASRLAAPVTLILPALAAWTFLDNALPNPVWRFRILLSLAAVVIFGFAGMKNKLA